MKNNSWFYCEKRKSHPLTERCASQCFECIGKQNVKENNTFKCPKCGTTVNETIGRCSCGHYFPLRIKN